MVRGRRASAVNIGLVKVEGCGVDVGVSVSAVERLNSMLRDIGFIAVKVLRGDIPGHRRSRVCDIVFLDRLDEFPGIDAIFDAFNGILDEAWSSVGREARKARIDVDRAEAVSCALSKLFSGKSMLGDAVIEWHSDVVVEKEGRIRFARLKVRYEISMDGVIGGAMINLGLQENESRCLGEGCNSRRLSRVVRGPRGCVFALMRNNSAKCVTFCISSCNKLRDYLVLSNSDTYM